VSAFFDRTLAVALDHAAPENCLTSVVRALQFEPRIVSVDRAAGEKVADLFSADDDIYAHCIAPPQRQAARDSEGR